MQDVVARLCPKPVPFVAGGVPLWLKPFDVAAKVDAAALARRKDEPGVLGEMFRVFVSRSVCTESGETFITPAMVDAMDSAIAEEIVNKVLEINGLTPDPKAPAPAGAS